MRVPQLFTTQFHHGRYNVPYPFFYGPREHPSPYLHTIFGCLGFGTARYAPISSEPNRTAPTVGNISCKGLLGVDGLAKKVTMQSFRGERHGAMAGCPKTITGKLTRMN